IQNSESSTGGLFQKFLAAECRAKIKVAKSDALELAGNLADEADLVALLGSPHSVNQLGLPWIQQEAALVRRLVAAGRPLFGICFGAQIIARAMGGTVRVMERRITGWLENDHAIDATWRGPWFRWHQEHIDPPTAASVLARSRSTIQAFQIGRTLGVQFHPEADQDIVTR